MTQEKAAALNHSLKITSGKEGQDRDIDDVGSLVLKNGVTNKEHAVTMWGEGIEDGALAYVSLYTNEPEEIIRLTGEDMSLDGAASDALTDYSLEDLIKTEDDFWPDIEKYGLEKTEHYEHEIALKDIKVDLHKLIVKEEITDLIMKGERAALTKKDVLNFGELVKDDEFSYELGNEFKAPIQKIVNENNFDAKEIDVIKSASKALNADVDFKSFVVSKEELQNAKLIGAVEPKETAHPKEFLEKFKELNALEPKLLLNEDRERGMIAMGVLLEKENLQPEFVPLSSKELSIFEYEPVARAGSELGNLNVDRLAARSTELISHKELMTIAGMTQQEAKEYLLKNSIQTLPEPGQVERFVEEKGLDPNQVYEWDSYFGKDMVLKYELGTDIKHIQLNEIDFEETPPAPNHDMYGQEIDSDPDWDYPTETTYYELNEKDLTFIDSKTKNEYPLESVMSERHLEHLKQSINSLDSTTIHLSSENIDSLKELTKEKSVDKSFSKNKGMKINKEEIEHSR
ncbi:hypothetical protein ACQKDB_16550 [Planococcus kocurii]|uniref:hypothetical protein n=1 Tax=Planococcus kocurii TaxID=1374 RepID=UPI003CFE0EE1